MPPVRILYLWKVRAALLCLECILKSEASVGREWTECVLRRCIVGIKRT